MLYCPSCKRVFEDGDKCPYCEEANVREASNEDKVLLLTADPEAASMIADKFNILEIDFETVDIERLGDSPFSGKAFIPDSEIYIFYKDYESANLAVEAVFEEIKDLNAPPTAKSVLSQVISIGLFILAVSAAIFIADIIAGLF